MTTKKRGGFKSVVFGFIASLIFGWWIFPHLLFSHHEQPFHYSHQVHLNQGLQCTNCHAYRSDGSFAGVPSLQSCSMCHQMVLGGTPAEEQFVQEYVHQNKPVPWQTYQRQPDNVYFSHIAHQDMDCTACHPDVGHSQDLPPVAVHKFTGYTEYTLSMQECEACHAQEGASNACFVCHK